MLPRRPLQNHQRAGAPRTATSVGSVHLAFMLGFAPAPRSHAENRWRCNQSVAGDAISRALESRDAQQETHALRYPARAWRNGASKHAGSVICLSWMKGGECCQTRGRWPSLRCGAPSMCPKRSRRSRKKALKAEKALGWGGFDDQVKATEARTVCMTFCHVGRRFQKAVAMCSHGQLRQSGEGCVDAKHFARKRL